MKAAELQVEVRRLINESLASGEITLGDAMSILQSANLDFYLAGREAAIAKSKNKSPIIRPRFDGGIGG